MKTKMRTFLEEKIKEEEQQLKVDIEEAENLEGKIGKGAWGNVWGNVRYLQGKIAGLKKALDLLTLIK